MAGAGERRRLAPQVQAVEATAAPPLGGQGRHHGGDRARSPAAPRRTAAAGERAAIRIGEARRGCGGGSREAGGGRGLGTRMCEGTSGPPGGRDAQRPPLTHPPLPLRLRGAAQPPCPAPRRLASPQLRARGGRGLPGPGVATGRPRAGQALKTDSALTALHRLACSEAASARRTRRERLLRGERLICCS